MTDFVFEIEDGRAIPVSEEREACSEVCFRLACGCGGVLVIGDARFPFGARGARISAAALRSGLHTPAFFVGGKRYEAPPLMALGGSLFFLPPTQAELYALVKRLKATEEMAQALQSRLLAIERRLSDTHIF